MKYAAGLLIPLLWSAPMTCLAQSVAAPSQPRRISMSVRDADLKDLLRAAAEGTDYNILFDPDLDTRVKGIDLKAVTFQELLDDILPSFGFSYARSGRTLHIRKSEGMMRFYQVDHLSMRRRGSKEFSVSASGQTLSASGSGGDSSSGGSSSGGSSSGQSSAYTSSLSSGNGVDPWAEIQVGLSTLIFGEPLVSTPSEGGTVTSPSSQAIARNGRTLLIHPESGLVVVNAEPVVQERVDRYLAEVKRRTGRQVLLEAKIVEVSLGNDSQIGVDWNSVLRQGAPTPGESGTGINLDFRSGGTISTNLGAAEGLFRIVAQNARISATLSALAREGRLQVLSSPRISTMNNQKAILRVVREEAFFLQSSQATSTGSGSGVLMTTTITPLVVPVGIVLDIQPQVAEDGTITLAVNPSVSEVVTTRSLTVSGQGGGASATLPVVDRRDLDTVVRMKNGETLVMAGIIKTKEGFDDRGIPWFRRIPLLGHLFSKREKTKSHTELAIFITPTLIEDSAQVQTQKDDTEQRLEKSGADLYPQPVNKLPLKTP